MKERGLSKIDLTVRPESAQIQIGESVSLSWSVRASKAYFVQQPHGEWGGPSADWRWLMPTSPEVKPEGEVTLHPPTSTTYLLSAIESDWRLARRVTVEVLKEKSSRGEPKTWYEDWHRLPPEWRQQFDAGVRRWRSCFGRSADVALSVWAQVLFVDEESSLTWEIACSDCAVMTDRGSHVTLIEDLTRRSGTRDISGVAWANNPPACSLRMRGDERIGAGAGQGRYAWTISAEAVWGRAAAATVEMGVMPHPLFDACDANRRGVVEAALKDIFGRLLNGCIRDNEALDDDIAAFADGHLSRVAFWDRLLAELENIDLTTFMCVDTSDEEWRGGRRQDYTTVIELHWSPSHAPNLPYVILHELIHKSGFNGDLSPYYSDQSIEEQAHALAAACF